MEYIIIVIFLVLVLCILKIIYGYSKKKIEAFAKNDELDNLTNKYPGNIEICKDVK